MLRGKYAVFLGMWVEEESSGDVWVGDQGAQECAGVEVLECRREGCVFAWGRGDGGGDSARVCKGAARVLGAGCARGVWPGARAPAAARLLACQGCSVGLTGQQARRSWSPDHVVTIAETAARITAPQALREPPASGGG